MPRFIPTSYRPIRALLTVAAAIALGGLAATAAHAALPIDEPFMAVAGNPADGLADLPLDDRAYDRATHCVKGPTPGAVALVKQLPRFSPRGESWGIMRCEKWGPHSASLHAEGRAVDWHLDVHDRADRADAEHLIRLLLAPGADGQPFALARRLGVQGLIWDCRAWWGGQGLVRYSACTDGDGRPKRRVDDTTAHRNHVHLELSKAGARLRTSWWTDGPGRRFAGTGR